MSRTFVPPNVHILSAAQRETAIPWRSEIGTVLTCWHSYFRYCAMSTIAHFLFPRRLWETVSFGISLRVAECHHCVREISYFPKPKERRRPMSNSSKHEILVVDDDGAIRDSLAMVLKSAGYGVSGAIHGFDALLQLRRVIPSVIISDLNMPQMSGFEFLSVVRRRFPQIPVIAMSGAYDCGDAVPGGVIADAFYPKGQGNPGELLRVVADLIHTSAARTVAHQTESAPVWIPRNGNDSNGIPYVVLTCI